MIKRTAILLLTILLVSMSAVGAESSAALDTYYNFFCSLEGQIAFALPGKPSLVSTEPDLTKEDAQKLGIPYLSWRNKRQLHGNTFSGTEYQVHLGDLTWTRERIQEEYPDENLTTWQCNAMLQMVIFYLNMYDGAFTQQPQLERIQADGRTAGIIYFDYSYPDVPGIKYTGKGIMDGENTVVVMGEKNEELECMLDQLRIVSDAEAAEFWRSRVPKTVTIADMQLTFPVPPRQRQDGGVMAFDAFSPEYAYFLAGFETEQTPQAELLLRMKLLQIANSYVQQEVIEEYSIKRLAAGCLLLDAYRTQNEMAKTIGLPRERVQCYLTSKGMYTLGFPDTEEGKAFSESVVFLQE